MRRLWNWWQARIDRQGPVNTPAYIRRQRIVGLVGILGFAVMGWFFGTNPDDVFADWERWFVIGYCVLFTTITVWWVWAVGAKADHYEAKRLDRIAKRKERRQ